MKKKKICLMYNHFQSQDGVNRSAMAIANELVKRNDVEVTLMPLFKYEKQCHEFLDKRVIVKPVFGFYFHGFTKLVNLMPGKLLYRWSINNQFDVNIAFQYGHSQKIIAAGAHPSHVSISWMHGYDEGLFYKDCYSKMNKLVCVSKSNAERLSNEIGEIVPVDFNYNPIDDTNIRKQGEQSIDIKRSRDVLFVTVGRMSPEKGYERLLNCVKRLKNENYAFSLWLIGDGVLLDLLRQQSQKLGIDNIVTFLGKKNNPHAYTSKADVFICSSFVEGYSTACTEAIMLNVPVISTNVSGANEIIEEARCGEVFDSSEDAIYQSMKRILDNPNVINDWKKILEKTKYNFSSEKRFEKFIKIVGL